MKLVTGALLLVLFLLAVLAAADDPDPQRVYITETGRKYHRAGCPYLERSRIPLTLQQAVSLGYAPCGYCLPPLYEERPAAPASPAILYRVNIANVGSYREAEIGRMTRAVVVRHVDGDTVYVSIPRPPSRIEHYERVRLLGVDTPETDHPQKAVESFGEQASQFTRTRLLYRIVYLAFDWQLRDLYGRLLAYVYFPDGSCHNADLLREGYAHAYTRFPFQFLEEFRCLERQAREEGRGLWKSGP